MSSQELNHRSIGVHFYKIILQTSLQDGKLVTMFFLLIYNLSQSKYELQTYELGL